ncbi:DUF2062 domain-containing protein [Dongshaea marina]|uniref:DUF2062 domain-containing protein n=1 Tax=Dongshaea marina TaxID=2047966 RepID=UPI000D3E3F7D|nr:DUF2062 domain-containing protein [Dongshaea marina]
MKLQRRINRFLPDPAKIKQNRFLRVFGSRLYRNNLWQLNRRSVAGAFAVSLFMAWVPLPCQMLLAAGAAILFSANLPVAVALAWVSNPVTIPPMLYFAYKTGAALLQQPPLHLPFELNTQWLLQSLQQVGPSLLLGCLLCALCCSLAGYIAVRGLWRYSVVRSWQRRSQARSLYN